MLGGSYKTFIKVIATPLQKMLSIVHPLVLNSMEIDMGLLRGHDILQNSLNVEMVVDYVKQSKQQIVMIQIDIQKVYDHISWLFVPQLMSHMGINARIYYLTFILWSRHNATCHVDLRSDHGNTFDKVCTIRIPIFCHRYSALSCDA